MYTVNLSADVVINRMHLLVPATRRWPNSTAGRVLRGVVECRGGWKAPERDRYAPSGDPDAPRSGQRYEINARVVTPSGLDDLALDTAAELQRRSGRSRR